MVNSDMITTYMLIAFTQILEEVLIGFESTSGYSFENRASNIETQRNILLGQIYFYLNRKHIIVINEKDNYR